MGWSTENGNGVGVEGPAVGGWSGGTDGAREAPRRGARRRSLGAGGGSGLDGGFSVMGGGAIV